MPWLLYLPGVVFGLCFCVRPEAVVHVSTKNPNHSFDNEARMFKTRPLPRYLRQISPTGQCRALSPMDLPTVVNATQTMELCTSFGGQNLRMDKVRRVACVALRLVCRDKKRHQKKKRQNMGKVRKRHRIRNRRLYNAGYCTVQ
jgi:hypothetical protein